MQVVAVGARAPTGLNALQIATATRALALEPGATRFVDADGNAVGLATVRALPTSAIGFERFAALAAPALAEAAVSAKGPLPVVLALPDATRPDQAEDSRMGLPLLEEIAKRAKVEVNLRESEIVRAGHAGFATALARATHTIANYPHGVIFGGVDSAYHAGVVQWLDERGHLLRLGGTHGRIPGEAAAFVHVAMADERAKNKHAWIRMSDVSDDAQGMGRLLRRVAGTSRRGAVGWVLSDLNGEPARTEAWLAAETVAHDLLSEAVHEDFVQHLSDVGAATGALLTVLAITWARAGSVRAPNVLVATSSDGPERGAFVLDLPPPSGSFVASIGAVVDRKLGRSARARTPSDAERTMMERIARGRLEDIGSMALLMTPGEDDDHPTETFAQRLLDAFDALAAIGTPVPGATFHPDIFGIVDRYERESHASDRARRFATVFARAHLGRRR